MKELPIADLQLPVFKTFSKDWFLVAAGDYAAGSWNCMTVSWGFVGTMWGKPVAQIVIRPQRYTREFLDAGGTFTLSSFDESHRDALKLLGTKSGRDGDKVTEAGLHPMASRHVPSPSFQEAAMTFECKILYRQPMEKGSFLAPGLLLDWYPAEDYHIIYIGEILAAVR